MESDYKSKKSFLAPSANAFSLPIYLHRQAILEAARKAAPHIAGRVLDVGCGRKPYKEIFTAANEYIGVDVSSSPHLNREMDRIYDGITLPFDDSSFDSVICTEVLEHCADPKRMVAEIARVLRPRGYLFLTVPFVYHQHEIPYDYFRFTRFGLESLAAGSGLHLKWLKMRGGVYSVWVQSTYHAISYTVSRFPVVQLIYIAFWPIARLALFCDLWRRGRDEISLGWQLLCQKQ